MEKGLGNPIFPRYIAVEGPIGVGKTTLVHALAERFDARVVLETFEENPFLKLFYQKQDRYALQTELFFLLSRYRQMQSFSPNDSKKQVTVSDYAFCKCRLFAQLTLPKEEARLFEQFYEILCRSLPEPDMVILLHAPIDVLVERIAHRGREYEREIASDYLEQLSDVYKKEFLDSKNSILSIDTRQIDFREARNIDVLVSLLKKGHRGPCPSEAFFNDSFP